MAGVVTTVVRVPFEVKVSVLPVPARLSVLRVAPVVTIPVGVVQVPEAVVQNSTVNCLIEVVTVAVKAPSYWTEAKPARESEIAILALVSVPALTF